MAENGKFCLENETWYKEMDQKGRHIADLICKYHKYFKEQDSKYKQIVCLLKGLILFLSMLSTIVLGLKTVIQIDIQIIAGLVLSAVITFLTGIAGYFNFEEYWMRNITIHIRLNILRDNFIFDAVADRLDDSKLRYYMDELDKIQNDNKDYWEKAIKKI